MNERREGFNQGCIAMLAVIKHFDNEVCWAEAVRTVGVEEMVRHAYFNEGDWRWAGFERYAGRNFGDAVVNAAISKGPLPKMSRVDLIELTDEQRKHLTVARDVFIPGRSA